MMYTSGSLELNANELHAHRKHCMNAQIVNMLCYTCKRNLSLERSILSADDDIKFDWLRFKQKLNESRRLLTLSFNSVCLPSEFIELYANNLLLHCNFTSVGFSRDFTLQLMRISKCTELRLRNQPRTDFRHDFLELCWKTREIKLPWNFI